MHKTYIESMCAVNLSKRQILALKLTQNSERSCLGWWCDSQVTPQDAFCHKLINSLHGDVEFSPYANIVPCTF